MHGKQPSGRPVRQSSRSNATAKPPSWWSAKLLCRSSVRRHGTHATLPGRLANKSLFAAEAHSVRARQRDDPEGARSVEVGSPSRVAALLRPALSANRYTWPKQYLLAANEDARASARPTSAFACRQIRWQLSTSGSSATRDRSRRALK